MKIIERWGKSYLLSKNTYTDLCIDFASLFVRCCMVLEMVRCIWILYHWWHDALGVGCFDNITAIGSHIKTKEWPDRFQCLVVERVSSSSSPFLLEATEEIISTQTDSKYHIVESSSISFQSSMHELTLQR